MIECCAIEMKPNILLISIYRPDREIEAFFEFIDKLLLKLKDKTKKHIVITGDFNINMLSNSKEYQRLINTMKENNFHQIIKDPTRETATSSTCIDLLFTNNRVFQASVEDLGVSDHKSLIYRFPINLNQQNNTKKHYI